MHPRLENLLVRFEEPSSMVRWDSPLFTVPWTEEVPAEQIAQALLTGNVKPPNSGTLAVRTSSKWVLLIHLFLNTPIGRQSTIRRIACS